MKTQLVALTMRDSSSPVMHFVLDDGHGRSVAGTDAEIESEIARQPYARQVLSWRRIDVEEYRDIRAARPKPIPKPTLEERVAALEANSP